MKTSLPIWILALATAGLNTAQAASTEDVLADLVAGQCLSEMTGAPLPKGFIDPRKSGSRVPARMTDGSAPGFLVKASNGPVTYYRADPFCTVQAQGLNPTSTIDRIAQVLKTLGRASEQTPSTPMGGGMAGAVMMITVPLDNPAIPIVMFKYNETNPQVPFQAALTIGR
jgi:hypothetical protein